MASPQPENIKLEFIDVKCEPKNEAIQPIEQIEVLQPKIDPIEQIEAIHPPIGVKIEPKNEPIEQIEVIQPKIEPIEQIEEIHAPSMVFMPLPAQVKTEIAKDKNVNTKDPLDDTNQPWRITTTYKIPQQDIPTIPDSPIKKPPQAVSTIPKKGPFFTIFWLCIALVM